MNSFIGIKWSTNKMGPKGIKTNIQMHIRKWTKLGGIERIVHNFMDT